MSTQQLNRTLGLRLVIVLVIANMIGSGVYKKVAPMADLTFIRLGIDCMGDRRYNQFVWCIKLC